LFSCIIFKWRFGLGVVCVSGFWVSDMGYLYVFQTIVRPMIYELARILFALAMVAVFAFLWVQLVVLIAETTL